MGVNMETALFLPFRFRGKWKHAAVLPLFLNLAMVSISPLVATLSLSNQFPIVYPLHALRSNFFTSSDPTIDAALLRLVLLLPPPSILGLRDLIYVLVILRICLRTLMPSREVSAAREEVPGRRGYPGYMYTDLSTTFTNVLDVWSAERFHYPIAPF
jgi:hypothetical protein